MDTGNSEYLRLYATDREDLTVMAAMLQDAVARTGDLAYLPREHRFVGVFNRYRWEGRRSGGTGKRLRTGLQFRGVLGVQTLGYDHRQPDEVLELLTIESEDGVEGAATIRLIFAGGTTIRLDTECIDAELADLGGPWQARARPQHPDADGD
jgi:hypothetical protein